MGQPLGTTQKIEQRQAFSTRFFTKMWAEAHFFLGVGQGSVDGGVGEGVAGLVPLVSALWAKGKSSYTYHGASSGRTGSMGDFPLQHLAPARPHSRVISLTRGARGRIDTSESDSAR